MSYWDAWLNQAYPGIVSPIAQQVYADQARANQQAAAQQAYQQGLWGMDPATDALREIHEVSERVNAAWKKLAAPVHYLCVCGQTAWGHVPNQLTRAVCGDCQAAHCKDLDLRDIDTRIAAVIVEPAYGDVGPWDARDAEYEL